MRRVAAVILAGGASTRLGEPKQLVEIAGEHLLARAVRIAHDAECSPIVVVLGASAASILAECPLPLARIVLNQAWAEGIASSIRVGVASIASEVESTILMTCDQPAVTSEHLRRLMTGEPGEIAASLYAGRRGVPACFPASSFADLMRLQGDTGAASLLVSARTVALPGGEIDVDTPESLTRARAIAM